MTDFTNPPADPLPWLQTWLDDARATGLPNPNAMTLATATADGAPSARIVLLKSLDERGVTFFTNYRSRKGRELNANPRVALLFFWDVLERQVRIEGIATRVGEAESDAYHASRHRSSQIGAWASAQSEPIADRDALLAEVARYEREFDGRDVPRPPHWGGWRVGLDRIEFWQGRQFRVHDRIVYEPRDTGGGWAITRLCP